MASTNPAERFFEWEGDKGHIYWYDKEKQERIKEPFPFMFLYLDQLYCISGYNKANDTGIYSNEVGNTKNQKLIVKMNDGSEVARGYYSDIKDIVIGKGGKFTASVYLIYMDQFKKPHIGNLKLRGAAISNWFDFLKKAGDGIINKGVLIHKFSEDSNGNVTYRVPHFKLHDIKEQSVKIADEKHEEIKPYIEEKSKVQEIQPEPAGNRPAQSQSPQGPGQGDPRPQPYNVGDQPAQEEQPVKGMPNMPDEFDDDDLPF